MFGYYNNLSDQAKVTLIASIVAIALAAMGTQGDSRSDEYHSWSYALSCSFKNIRN